MGDKGGDDERSIAELNLKSHTGSYNLTFTEATQKESLVRAILLER